ncbi:MAG: hypothetical protein E7058_07345 [Lentisphaerae bacterium]|nr:hypothetical protein [Lentisphaerota bacterium]
MKKRVLKVYFAGDLFDSKDLGGNVMLASAMEKVSGGRYQVILPQDGECEIVNRTSQSIRDCDFLQLFQSDLIVANFDGHDLDSGTVTEFCFAKMVDIPAVLLRTDFRFSGDGTLPDGDPWNLMCSHYPRTEVRHINGMKLYHECRSGAGGIELYYQRIAAIVTEAMDTVITQPSWLKADQALGQYRNAVKSIGGSLDKLLDEQSLANVVTGKIAAGIYGA